MIHYCYVYYSFQIYHKTYRQMHYFLSIDNRFNYKKRTQQTCGLVENKHCQ